MRKNRLSFLLLLTCFTLSGKSYGNAGPSSIKVGVAFIPGLAENLSDPIPTLVKRIIEINSLKSEIEIAPFKRSIANVATGASDIHIPFIYNPAVNKKQDKYRFSSSTLWKVNFVVYTHKDTDFDINKIEEYQLATNTSYTKMFGFKLKALPYMKSAIQMVASKRVDGIIYPDQVIDPIIKAQGIKNIRRTFFQSFQAKALIHKSANADAIDQIIANGMAQLHQSGEIAQLKLPTSQFDDWQPFEE